jgi:membrane fusion protein (multidrug efflux system)
VAATKPGKRKFVMMGVLALVALAAASYAVYYVFVGRFYVSTDDAYVRANTTTLGAKVSGYISELLVEENSKVRAGDVIARIDDGDNRLAADSARDKVATQEATIERFDRQIDAQRAAVEQAQAQLASARAAQTRMESEFERQQALAGKQFASRQTLEQSIANRDQANASVLSAQAALDGITDVTAQVTGSGYVIGPHAKGFSLTVMMQVKATRKASGSASFLLKAISGNDPSFVDGVKAVVKVI